MLMFKSVCFQTLKHIGDEVNWLPNVESMKYLARGGLLGVSVLAAFQPEWNVLYSVVCTLKTTDRTLSEIVYGYAILNTCDHTGHHV